MFTCFLVFLIIILKYWDSSFRLFCALAVFTPWTISLPTSNPPSSLDATIWLLCFEYCYFKKYIQEEGSTDLVKVCILLLIPSLH